MLEDLGSPIGAFIRDRCQLGGGLSVEREELFAVWRGWCIDTGRDHPGTAATFGRDLRSAVPGLKTTQPRDAGGGRKRLYDGIALK
jgi:putative DNA primase/helicase